MKGNHNEKKIGTFLKLKRIRDMTTKQNRKETKMKNLTIKETTEVKYVNGKLTETDKTQFEIVDLNGRMDLGALGMTDIPLEVFKTRQEAEEYINK